MGKLVKSETTSLPISDGLVMYLYDAGDSCGNYSRVDFVNYSNYNDFLMIMDRSKLKEVAEFILKYLDNE
jgi:hypothetical protein